MAPKPKKSPPKKSKGGQAGSGERQTTQRAQTARDSSAAASQGPAQSQEQGMASNQSQEQPQAQQGQQQPQQGQAQQGQSQQQPQQGQAQQDQGQQQPQQGQSEQQPQQSQQGQGQSEQQQGEQSGEEQSSGESSDVTNVLDLDLQPLRVDLLGLVVKTEEIHVMIDAESGEGKLVGNLVGQLTTLLDSIDLSALTGQLTETAQNTMTGLAGEASNQVQQQGSKLIGSAVQSLSGYLQNKVPGAGAAGQAKEQAESAASGGE